MLPFLSIFILFTVSIAFLLFLKIRDDKSSGKNVLANFSRDLTKLAEEGKLDPVVGRNNEISRVIQILCRRTKNNPVLLGEAGVGKTAIIEGLAQAIVNKKVPEMIKGKILHSLDLGSLLAGTKYRGDFEQRLKGIINEIARHKRKIILFVDEIHAISEAGDAIGAINAVDLLKPALARGEMQMIGATTLKDYKKFIMPDLTLERRFQPVIIDEPSKKETVSILVGIKSKYEDFHNIRIPNSIITKIVEISSDIKGRVYPDKAIDLMDESSAKVSLQLVKEGKKNIHPALAYSIVKEVHDEWKKNNKLSS